MAKKTDVTQVLGVPGLSLWQGVLQEEYLAAIKGSRRWKIYREMSDDAVIATLLDAIMMPLLAAEIDTVAGETAADKEAATFLSECMNDMNKYEWRQHVFDLLSMMQYGFAISEMVFKKRSGPEGDPPSKYTDGKIGLKILDPRGQETLYRWELDEEFNVTAFIQQDPITGLYRTIEAWKMVHVTFRSRKRSPEGMSPLRSLYRAWYTRKNLEIIEAIGAERDLAGLPVMTLPQGATPADKAAAEEIVRKVRLDEEAGVVLPPPPPGAEFGWKFELLSGGSKMYDTRAIINDLNKIILMRFFAQFLLLGMEKVGTQALVAGSQDFFSLALKSIQQELLEGWNRQLIPLLFSLNPGSFTGKTDLPQINWGSPGKDDVAAMVDMMQKSVGAQVLTPDATLEDWFRKMAGLPDRPEGVGEGPRGALPLVPGGGGWMSYDWYQMPDGNWLLTKKKAPAFGTGADFSTAREKLYADVSGTRGRPVRGNLAKATNEYQGELVEAYDVWSAGIKKQLMKADKEGKSIDELTAILDDGLKELALTLKEVGRGGIARAVAMGYGKNLSPAALQKVAELIEANEKYIDESLIPRLRERFVQFFQDSLKTYKKKKYFAFDAAALGSLVISLRSGPAGYSGGFWSAVFHGAGLFRKEDDTDRAAAGESPRRVKWVLDPTVEHCQASAGFYGCEDLEGTYDSWDDLPTVPAGQVTCRGNCRCEIEIEESRGDWGRAV